ncbi:hypothetical protein ACS3QZ_14920 [Shimia sp. W99]
MGVSLAISKTTTDTSTVTVGIALTRVRTWITRPAATIIPSGITGPLTSIIVTRIAGARFLSYNRGRRDEKSCNNRDSIGCAKDEF